MTDSAPLLYVGEYVSLFLEIIKYLHILSIFQKKGTTKGNFIIAN